MSRILVLCDQGNNRSTTIAQQIKYLKHDVLTAGLSTNTPETLRLLIDWAERVIVTDHEQQRKLKDEPKVELWNVGPDNYPRPFNPQLLAITRRLIQQHA